MIDSRIEIRHDTNGSRSHREKINRKQLCGCSVSSAYLNNVKLITQLSINHISLYHDINSTNGHWCVNKSHLFYSIGIKFKNGGVDQIYSV